ncbi:MAG TPA: hypothetical protein PLV92_26590 [Pirellulaceae bacterium]|nr:hypothetical protein [Pirellulaceae bacterium]
MKSRTKSRIKSRMKPRPGATLVELLIVMSACSVVLTTSAVLMHRVFRAHSQSQAFLASQRNGQRFAEQLRRDIHRATSAELGEANNQATIPTFSTTTPISVSSVPSVAELPLPSRSVPSLAAPPRAPSLAALYSPSRSVPPLAATAQNNSADEPDALLLRLDLNGGTQAEYRWHAGAVTRVESVAGRTLSRDEFTFPVQAKLKARRLDAPARIVVTISSEVVVPEADAVNAPPPAHATLARFEIAAALGRDTRYVDAAQFDDPREQEQETVR